MTSTPILLPDKSTISASQMGLLPNPNLSKIGRKVKILPQLRSASLISVGKLCDDGCTVHFDNNKMNVHKNNQIIMSGIQNHEDGLYDIPIAKVHVSKNNYQPPQLHPALYYNNTPRKPVWNVKKEINKVTPRINLLRKAFPRLHKLASHNECDQIIEEQEIIDHKCHIIAEIFRSHPTLSVIIRKNQTKADLARYLHAAWFSPVKSTWKKSTQNNHFTTWPGLTTQLILNHVPLSQETVQGHIKQEQHGLQSTTKPNKTYKNKMEELRIKLQLLKAKRKPNETLHDVITQDIMTDAYPSSPSPNIQTHQVAYAVIDPDELINGYFDLAGKFINWLINKYVTIL
jgi:hypothetical protein